MAFGMYDIFSSSQNKHYVENVLVFFMKHASMTEI